ncbi:MAG: hypothetical protein GEU86_12390 [Actinophytocola sp.]|nr:hypothetical protein [Actinophytocola sp.]
MAVVVDGLAGGRADGRALRRTPAAGGVGLAPRRVANPVRRRADEALRRPPGGARRADEPPGGRVTACVVTRPAPRWRLVVLTGLAVCAVIFGFGVIVGGMADGMAGSSVPARTTVVAVAPGESLWDLAVKYAPESDPRAVVRRIEDLNGVDSGAVTAGLALTVPVAPGAVPAG